MKEAISIFQKGLMIGLSPSPYYNTQAESLNQCYNLVPEASGVEARQEIFEAPFEFPSRPWPFPALYRTARYDLIFLDDELFEWRKDNTGRSLINKVWGGLPHIADFMDTIIFATPNDDFIYTMFGGISQNLGGAKFKTCCNFKGQLIIGDCTLPHGPLAESCTEPEYSVRVGGPEIVAWSKIGQLDWEYTLGNEVGWAPMPWPGPVLKVLPLQNEVIAYCTNGIAKLKPASQPTQTFGIQEFGDIGLLNRECVDGSHSHY